MFRLPPSVWVATAWVGGLLNAGAAMAQAAPAPSRGQLLYGTHCIACHDQRLHWRDQRRATDWTTLRDWVRHWQGAEQLRWGDDDIDEVARHLNDTIYRFPSPVAPRG